MIDKDDYITKKHGYEAMLRLLHNFWELTGSNDLTDILSGGEYWKDQKPADPVFWDYWVDALEEVNLKGPLYKELKK